MTRPRHLALLAILTAPFIPHTASARAAVDMACVGNVNLYNSFGQYARTEQFGFRVRVHVDRGIVRVVSVQKGPLLSPDQELPVTTFDEDVLVFAASSTVRYIAVPSLRLDIKTGQISGRGDIVGSLTQGRRVGSRRVEVDGLCEAA